MAIGIVVATLLGVAAGSLVLGALAGSVGRFDLDVVEDLAADRTAVLDDITAAGEVLTGTITVAILWIGAMVIAGWRTQRLVLPAFLLVAIGGEKLTYLLTSLVVGRQRPPVEPLGHVYATSSFPSGHVGSAVTLYGAVLIAVAWHRARHGHPLRSWVAALGGVVVAAVVALVAFSRVYRGQHYPSDVVWGVLLGVAWLSVGWRSVLAPHGRPEVGPGRTVRPSDRRSS